MMVRLPFAGTLIRVLTLKVQLAFEAITICDDELTLKTIVSCAVNASSVGI